MGPIRIDLSDVVAAFDGINVEELSSAVLGSVVGGLSDTLSDLASTKLNKSRSAYLNGIIMDINSSTSGFIELQGELANAVEQGIGPFDMKEKMLDGAPGGINIPFRHATPGNGAGAEFASTMTEEMYDVVGMKQPMERVTHDELPSRHKVAGNRKAIKNKAGKVIFGQYKHKVAKYQDIRKERNNSGSSQYKTYRKMSENSDPLAWIHPGIVARNLFGKAVQSEQWKTAAQIGIDNYLKAAGFS